MSSFPFMDKIRSFLGLAQDPPRNDFRNPIWGDDDDDGDELYERQAHINIYTDPLEVTRQMLDMFKTFSGMFDENMSRAFQNEHFSNFAGAGITETSPDSGDFDSNNIRDYYLKPGYQRKLDQPKQDLDLDGKISSNEISGLLNKKDGSNVTSVKPFDSKIVPGRSFCKTIITTSITKPDGTVETKRIIKNGNEVTEEVITTTSSGSDTWNPSNPGLISTPDMFYQNIISEFSNRWRNFH